MPREACSLPGGEFKLVPVYILYAAKLLGRNPNSYLQVKAQVTQHIGIVACSAEGAALCYRTICLEALPPLIVRPEDAPLPTLDSTRLLAKAALRRAIGVYSRTSA